MRWLTFTAIGGLIIAAVLAAIGGFPLDNPMPTHSFGLVEPTCGLTRGSTAIARGDFATAWRYNPAAFLVMGLGAAFVIRAIVGWTMHRWVNLHGRPGKYAYLVGAAAFVALWVYQQTNADFIINSRI